MASRVVLNYPLSDEYYAITHRSTPMATQRSTGSTDSNWSHSSTASYQSQASSQHYGNSKHRPSTQQTSKFPSYGAPYGQTSNSQYRGAPTSPSDKSDKDSNMLHYCSHQDCLDVDGRPIKSFSRKADVSRHYKSTHEKQWIDCPLPRCHRKGENGFTRMDHLKEHQRGYHNDPIPKRQNSNEARSRHEY